DTAVDGIIIIDEHARIVMVNKACEKLFGYTAADLLGQSVTMIMPPTYAVEHDRFVAEYMRTGVRRVIGIGRDLQGQHRDGTVFPFNLLLGEVMTPEGRQFVGILRALRPRHDAEQ